MSDNPQNPEQKLVKIEFQARPGEPAITLSLSGASSEIHKSPEKLRKIMELLDLPEGTVATVTVSIATSVVR